MACVDATVLPVLALESLGALLCVAIIGQWLDLLSAMQPTFAVRENGLFLVSSLQLGGFVFSLQLAAFKSVSPLASFFLLLRQKKETRHRRKLLKPASGKLENTIRFHGYPQKQKSAAMPTTGPANDQYWQVTNHHGGKLR